MELIEKHKGIDLVGTGILKLYRGELAENVWFKMGIKDISMSGITYGALYVHNCTTQNCQLNVLGHTEGFLAPFLYDDKKYEPIKEYVKLSFAHLAQQLGRQLLLMDVHVKYKSYIEQIFGKNNIILYAPYTSSNNSSMAIVIVNIMELRQFGIDMRIKVTPIPQIKNTPAPALSQSPVSSL